MAKTKATANLGFFNPARGATAAVEKENSPPGKNKSFNINALLDRSRRLHRDRHHALSPRPTGISKTPGKKQGYYARVVQHFNDEKASARKAAQHVAPSRIPDDGAPEQKQKTFNSSVNDALQSFNSKVLARREKYTATEKTLNDLERDVEEGKPAADDKEEFDRLNAELKDLDIRFEDEIIPLTFRRSDGSTKTSNYRIGDLIDKCEAKKARELQKIAQFEKECAAVVAEITKLRKTIMDDDEATKTAVKEHEAQMAAFEKELQKIEKQAKAEEADLRREQKAAIAAFNKKINDLWESI